MIVLNTKKGKIKGIQEANYQAFLGIPYAKAPTGKLRFQEPQPMEAWENIRDCTKFGPIAPQHQADMPPINQPESEDCLYLNVWTPKADDQLRPVMAWIHGGAFLIGAGSRPRLNGARLASFGDVVVVTFNYRMGSLGFLNLPWIPPNLGIQDQIAALKWIKENIKAFGGDPNNITIFGESAGGGSVSILLAIPTARGLFHRAIMESGVASPLDYEPESAKKGAEKFISKLGISGENIEELQAIQLKKIIRTQKKIAGLIGLSFNNPFRPYVDGKIIPEHPLELIRKGKASKVPIIIGTNLNEASFINAFFTMATDDSKTKNLNVTLKDGIKALGLKEKDIDKLIAIYEKTVREKYPSKPFKYWEMLITDLMFRIPSIRQLEAFIQHHPDAYCYLFTMGASKDGNAFHTVEIPFVFGNLDSEDMNENFVGTGESAKKLSEIMMRAWTSFARVGNPNYEGLPKWPSYDLQGRATMIFNDPPREENAPIDELRKAWDGIL
ncbi:MAG: carboxylesterase/lipase family protein [Promethearchaeota archaeon]